MAKKDTTVECLREKYEKDEAFKRVCDDLAGRAKNSWKSTVDRISQRTGLSRGEVIRVFKQLGEVDGIGTFLAGRRGQPSRFEWEKSSLSVARAAAGEGVEIEARPTDDRELENEEVVHRYRLRSDLEVQFSLPSDLKKSEAERLAQFINSLPLE